MATGKRNVSITIRAVDEASKVIGNIGTKALPDLAKRVAGFAAGIASVATVGEVIKKAFEGALEAEQATQKLTTALVAQKLSVASYLPHLSAYAVSLSHVTKATDEQIKGVQQLLISVGGLSGQSLDKATVATMNLAAGLGIDLNDAAMKVAKAANGSTREFTRLGVKFSDTATDGEKLARVMDFIEKRFGGAAQAEVTTLAGKIDLLTKSWNELNEAIAMQATGNKQVPGALDGITATMNLITDSVEKGKLAEALGIVTKIGMVLSGDVDPRFWLQLVAAVDHLKMADLTNLRLATKFPEDADPAIENLKKDMDELIARNAKLETSTDKIREAYEKLTGTPMPRMPGTPEPVAPARLTPPLNAVADPTRFGLASPRSTEAPRVIPVKVEVDTPKVENDWARQIFESAKKAKEEADALQATLDRFKANTEVQVIAPKVAEPKTPITGPSSDFVIAGIVKGATDAAALTEQLDALRQAEIGLTAPIHDVADAWGKVNDAVRTVAAGMPDAAKGGAGGINELIQKLEIAAQKAVEARGAAAITANVEAANALTAALASMSYLTPEQQEQLDALLSAILEIGKAQETNAVSLTEHAEQVQIGVDAAKQAALGLSGLMVDAAFGVKQSWGDALKSLLMGIAKAIIQALILKAINTALKAATGGFSVVAINMSGGGEVKRPIGAASGAIVPTIYAADGSAGIRTAQGAVPSFTHYLAGGGPQFKPRGTDTVPAMLTPGEIVLPRHVAQDLLKGEVTITAGKDATAGSRKIIGGRIAVSPSDDRKPPMIAPSSSQVTIRAPKGAHGAVAFEQGGIAYAASGMIVPQAARAFRAPMILPDSSAVAAAYVGRSGFSVARGASGGSAAPRPAPVATRTHVPINIGGARLTDLLITNSDAVVDVLEYIDSRRR